MAFSQSLVLCPSMICKLVCLAFRSKYPPPPLPVCLLKIAFKIIVIVDHRSFLYKAVYMHVENCFHWLSTGPDISTEKKTKPRMTGLMRLVDLLLYQVHCGVTNTVPFEYFGCFWFCSCCVLFFVVWLVHVLGALLFKYSCRCQA